MADRALQKNLARFRLQEAVTALPPEELARQIEYYQKIINTAAEGYWELDAEQRTVMVNEALCAMLGYSPEEMLGRTLFDFVDRSDIEICRQQMALREQHRNRVYDVVLRTKEGRDLQARFHATPIFDEGGEFTGSFAFITDITELLAIRESAAAYALKLERSNRELHDFDHIVSHDLQEPLHTIVAFGDRLLARHADQLDDKACQYLERISKAALRMQQMVEDLLNYSRVTSLEQEPALVDLDKLLREVLEDLEQRLKECNGRVEVAPLGTVSADYGQMYRLFLNLICNALKFQHKEAQPLVKVSRKELADQRVEIVVEDNGIGFDEKYLERIFRPFQRLHARGVYQGTGMGLAICKKIVESHQGELRARSQPGVGTTFSVILPL